MSKSKHAVELCSLLVDEAYGELASRIFTILLRRGRLPIPLLAKHTRLTPRQLRHGLAVLVQQGLVYYNLDADTKTTNYEANHDAAYGLVRSGKIMDAVESSYGKDARDVVQNLFLFGHTKVSGLEGAYDSKSKKHVNGHDEMDITNGANGHGETSAIPNGQLHAILIRLLEAGVIQPVVKSMFRSPTDTYNAVEREVLRDDYGGNTKGAKQKEDLKLKIQSRLRELRSEGDWDGKGKKRPLNGSYSNGLNGNNKRRRLSIGVESVNGDNHYEDDGFRLDPDMVLRINYEKCVVALRNQKLAALAKSRIGEIPSIIYATALRLIEEKIPRCRLDPKMDETSDLPDGPTFSTMEVTAALSRSVNVSRGIGKEVVPGENLSGDAKGKKRRGVVVESDDSDDDDPFKPATNGDDQDSDTLMDDDEVRPAKRPRVTFQDQLPTPGASEDIESRALQVKKHLQILAEDECRFIRKTGTRGQGEWTVDFDHVVHFMKDAEIDAMMLENFGTHGHRLARMMRKMGRLEEKQLPNLVLIKHKDIRTKLAEMQMAGVVDIQEVPRDANRTNNRTIFLWYFEAERVATILLDGIYKAMSRCYQRLDVEKRKSQDVISLTERSDVRDLPPEEYLDAGQVNELERFRAKEQKILGEVARLDELVGTFRDY